jgi:hypothetical protein
MARISPKTSEVAGFLVLVAAYAVSFFADVRGRDAFVWMDPNQYFSFACDLLTGRRPVSGFELPSIFPFFVSVPLAISPSFAAALSINLAAALVLMAAVRALCKSMDIRWSPLVAACVLSSPLLVGLSRELYVEFTLSAIVALQFVLWFQSERFTRRRETILFAVLFTFGCLSKMTYPIYFAGPFLVEEILLLKERNFRGMVRCAAAVILPVLAALPVVFVLFPAGLGYYTSLGNTLIPAMPLFGPRILSLESLAYYPVQIWKTLLFLLTPLLLIPVLKFTGQRRWLILWAWFLVPMAILTLELKEPRYIAPCIVPAVLLIFDGISRLRRRPIRGALCALAVVLAVTQYGLVTEHRKAVPYYQDKPSMSVDLLDVMIEADPEKDHLADESGRVNPLRWTYSRNIALTGFDANMDLLYAWQFNPAVTYDLDLYERAPDGGRWETSNEFEDLYLLNAFGLYTRCCLWPRYYRTLDRETVVANADYILSNRGSPEELEREYPGHIFVKSLHARGETVHVLRAASMPRPSYRSLYAKAFLAGRTPTDEDYATIYYDLRMNAILRGDSAGLNAVEKEFGPRLNPAVPRRNIYWIGSYKRLQKIAVQLLGKR